MKGNTLDSAIPSPRNPFVGGGFTSVSAIDSRVKLYVDPLRFDFHIEFHTDASPYALESMLETAWLRGYCVDNGADFYEQTEMLDDTLMRVYLVPVEPVRDTAMEEDLPDLSTTAYGPHSGFMEAINV